MCGISGIFRRGIANPDDRVLVSKMNDAQAHRGPDADGIAQSGKCTLGHRRLSIIDLDGRSNQPFSDVTGRYTMVFNGQIYNFRDIKAELSDYPFHTTSDTEVLVAAYTKWGADCLQRLNGMFAFAIYDTREETLFIARDRFGVKPLYYYVDENIFAFASEMRALLSTGLVQRKLDYRGVKDLLMVQSSICPQTILQDVRQLHPAHWAKLSAPGELQEVRYWTPGETFPNHTANYTQACTDVRQLFFASVERRMISDVPFGAFLSGGIDSSAIVAAMSQVRSGIDTFSIAFQEAEFDESVYAEEIARLYNTRHHKLVLTPDEFIQEVPNALGAMDNPSADGMNLYVVSKLTKKAGVTVALSGIGGDELFAGYDNFKAWYRLKRSGYFNLPKSLRLGIASLMHKRRPGVSLERFQQIARSDGRISQAYQAFREDIRHDLMESILPESGERQSDAIRLDEGKIMDMLNPVSAYSVAELTLYTRNVLLKDTDQFCMAFALEVREPFFDHEFADYVIGLPAPWKMGNKPKKLLCDAMGNLLPDSIIYRQKRGFSLPWKFWLRNDLKDIVRDNLLYIEAQPGFNGSAIRKLYDTFQQGSDGSVDRYIWRLVSLSAWMRKNMQE